MTTICSSCGGGSWLFSSNALVVSLWRRWLRLRFHLFQKYRHENLVIERVAGLQFLVLPQVFNPALFWTSELLIDALTRTRLHEGAAVLDLGTGSGIGAVHAARFGGRVIATDINPEAARNARINALLHQVENRLEVREGDLFDPVRGLTFDLILFNPPYFAGPAGSMLERAFFGQDVLVRFLQEASRFLVPEGQILLALSSRADMAVIEGRIEQSDMVATPVIERRLPGETFVVLKLGLRRGRQPQTSPGPADARAPAPIGG